MNENEKPSRSLVGARINELIASPDRLTRERTTSWAKNCLSYLESDPGYDKRIWDALMALINADAELSPGEFMYHEEDFSEWLKLMN